MAPRSWSVSERFDTGRLSLDFVATLGRRGGSPVERIATPASFGHWLVTVGIAEPDLAVNEHHVDAAVVLREACATRKFDLPAQSSCAWF